MCKLYFYSTETQTDTFSMNSVSVAKQCNLLNATPLKHLSDLSVSLDDSFVTVTESEETNLDTSLCNSQEHCTTE